MARAAHRWKTPPFEPDVRPSNKVKGARDLYARGAADDKGQLFIHLLAVEAHLKVNGKLPVNVKFIFEGEEEIGSPNLVPLMKKHRTLLKDGDRGRAGGRLRRVRP